MLNRQKGYTSQKTIFCHFTLQNITMRKYFQKLQNYLDKPAFNK